MGEERSETVHFKANEDDVSLLQKMIQGDRQAELTLYERHTPRLVRIAGTRLAYQSNLMRRFDVDDVIQETWFEVSKRWKEYDDNATFFLWIRRVCLDKIGQLLREHQRDKRNVFRESYGSTSNPLIEHLVDTLTSPSSNMKREEEKALLKERLGLMSETDQEILRLRMYEDLSNSETAELLGIQEAAASNRLMRAAARLTELMDGHE